MRDVLRLSGVIGAAGAFSLAACASSPRAADEHGDHATSASPNASGSSAQVSSQRAALPADAGAAAARLAASTRHGEWVMIRSGSRDSVRAWVVYPERKTKAPVVVVIHEIFGMQDWVRAVADQLAADGFIAIAPDLLTGKETESGWNGTSAAQDKARAVIGQLDPAVTQQRITAVANYGMALPAATKKYGVVGYCWGGSTSFAHAVAAPDADAAVVYYGSAPTPYTQLASIRAPVLGLYGGNDARIGATIPATDSTMKALGKSYTPITFAGAGHGFLRQQSDSSGANMAATRDAWPRTIAFFRQHLGN